MKRLSLAFAVVNVGVAAADGLMAWRFGIHSRDDIGTGLFFLGVVIVVIGVGSWIGGGSMLGTSFNHPPNRDTLWTVARLAADDQRSVLQSGLPLAVASAPFGLFVALAGLPALAVGIGLSPR